MTYRIVPREAYGLPKVVRGSDGSLRPPLHNEPYMVAHYTGNNVDYTDKVTTEVVLQIQRIFGNSKPFEYNYVIGQEDNDEIYEFAGKFQAAHSAGENSISFGVLLLLGVGENPTPLMINKWQWLREVLQFEGSLAFPVKERMHFQMPGAATQCPGNVQDYWSEFLKPYQETDCEMTRDTYLLLPPVGSPDDYPWFLCEGANIRYANNRDGGRGYEQVRVPMDQYQITRHSVGV